MGPLVYTSGNAEERVRALLAEELQWGRWFTPAETGLALFAWVEASDASMGPLVYTSGNSIRTEAPPTPSHSFNGAAGLHQRKPALPTRSRAPPMRLQWGRWFTPAETDPSPPQAPPRAASFNGAAGLHQRKPRRMGQQRPRRHMLQWGRWFTPAETLRVMAPGRVAGLGFNGAAGLHQRKPAPGRPARRFRPAGFNGAAGLHQRKLHQRGDAS